MDKKIGCSLSDSCLTYNTKENKMGKFKNTFRNCIDCQCNIQEFSI